MMDALITEADLGPEPKARVGQHDEVLAWATWCAKATALRMSSLRDTVELWAFQTAITDLERFAGKAATRAFIKRAFRPGSEAMRAATVTARQPVLQCRTMPNWVKRG
jgi:hypothetical protein